MMQQSTRGFTLVEISIVLIILGLLAGGILTARSLIRAAEIRSVATNLQRYRVSINTFRDKYFQLPGDMTNATQFWGVRAGTGSDLTCHQTINSFTGTCNGDGDLRISTVAGDVTNGERFLAWQHMARAGLIEGNYSGASGSASSFVRTAGTNLPSARISNGMFELAWVSGPLAGDANYFDGTYNFNMLSVLHSTSYPLRAEEAWNLDVKIDNGLPATGIIFVYKNTSTWEPNCATTDVVSTAAYNTDKASNIDPMCYLNMALR